MKTNELDGLIRFFDYNLEVDGIDYSSHPVGWQDALMFELKDDDCGKDKHDRCGGRNSNPTDDEIDIWIKTGWPSL